MLACLPRCGSWPNVLVRSKAQCLLSVPRAHSWDPSSIIQISDGIIKWWVPYKCKLVCSSRTVAWWVKAALMVKLQCSSSQSTKRLWTLPFTLLLHAFLSPNGAECTVACAPHRKIKSVLCKSHQLIKGLTCKKIKHIIKEGFQQILKHQAVQHFWSDRQPSCAVASVARFQQYPPKENKPAIPIYPA